MTRCRRLAEENKTIRYVVWNSDKSLTSDTTLNDALKTVKKHQMIMSPLVENDPSSTWIQLTEEVLVHIKKLIGRSQYEAYEGVNPALNQVYFVKIKERLPDGRLVITNPLESGQKKKVKQVEAVVEPDLVYPLIRGRDIKR